MSWYLPPRSIPGMVEPPFAATTAVRLLGYVSINFAHLDPDILCPYFLLYQLDVEKPISSHAINSNQIKIQALTGSFTVQLCKALYRNQDFPAIIIDLTALLKCNK